MTMNHKHNSNETASRGQPRTSTTGTQPIPLQLHLGCGKRYLPGFVHVDLDDFPHVDYRNNIDSLPMFNDETVDLIYCCHAFQYFDRTAAGAVLREWHRILKPGGVLRLAVPDFDALAELYRRQGDLDLIIGPLFGRIEIVSPQGRQVIFHKTVYDETTLSQMCINAGFKSAARYDWRETAHSGFDDFSQAYYPHMAKETGLLVSLNLEAIR
jgi:predicted SAM-dependent methyltransferase